MLDSNRYFSTGPFDLVLSYHAYAKSHHPVDRPGRIMPAQVHHVHRIHGQSPMM
ncbi:hypothetical protein C7S16_0222 [Burkholderia thailandensis]|uniref:Uncharacterized protein n=1 Tax=Burkholderia thailandensis TaxID=57975 RepID=A0AAW9D498_BURTH|nr:hypothetical protein [Burkholderia thailandensis]MDW9256434.1 hypothetical protein [Burkholderia thailandensis]